MSGLRLSPFLDKVELDRSLTVVKDLKALPKNAEEIRWIYGEDGELDELSDQEWRDVVKLFGEVRDIRGPWAFIDRRTLELAELIPAFADALKTWADSVVSVVKELKFTEGYRRVEDLTEAQIQMFDAGQLSADDRNRFVTVAGTTKYLSDSFVRPYALIENIQIMNRAIRQNIDEDIKPLFQRVLGDYGASATESFNQVENATKVWRNQLLSLAATHAQLVGRGNEIESNAYRELKNSGVEHIMSAMNIELKEQKSLIGNLSGLIAIPYPLYARLNAMNKFVSGIGDALRNVEMLWVDAKVFIDSSNSKLLSINDKRSLRLFVADITGVANDWQVVKVDVQDILKKHKEL